MQFYVNRTLWQIYDFFNSRIVISRRLGSGSGAHDTHAATIFHRTIGLPACHYSAKRDSVERNLQH